MAGTLERFRHHAPLWVVLGCLASFLVTFNAPVKYTSSDSRFSLLTSLALLEGKGVRLDDYFHPEAVDTYYQIRRENGHLYNYNALGTSIVAAPFVALANLRGDSVRYEEMDRSLQTTLAALCVTATFLLLYLIGRAFVDVGDSLLIASAFTFGSQVMSTMGSALWNFDCEVVVLLGTLLLVLRTTTWPAQRAAALGALLLLAYLCRPTASIATVALLAAVFRRDRRAAIIGAAVFGIGLAVFMAWSLREYHMLLPWYYAGGRLALGHIGTAVYGNLASPARGLLVYCPYLLVVVVALAWTARTWRTSAPAWLALGWATTLFLAVSSSSAQWWGGFGFGPRLLTDIVPPLALLTAGAFAAMRQQLAASLVRRVATVFGVLMAVAILFHTYQGLYNGSTVKWNESPNIDQHPEYLFDWRHPQFLASPDMLEAREQARPR